MPKQRNWLTTIAGLTVLVLGGLKQYDLQVPYGDAAIQIAAGLGLVAAKDGRNKE